MQLKCVRIEEPCYVTIDAKRLQGKAPWHFKKKTWRRASGSQRYSLHGQCSSAFRKESIVHKKMCCEAKLCK